MPRESIPWRKAIFLAAVESDHVPLIIAGVFQQNDFDFILLLWLPRVRVVEFSRQAQGWQWTNSMLNRAVHSWKLQLWITITEHVKNWHRFAEQTRESVSLWQDWEARVGFFFLGWILWVKNSNASKKYLGEKPVGFMLFCFLMAFLQLFFLRSPW